MKPILLLAPAALTLATARPPAASAPPLPYDLNLADELTYTVPPVAPRVPPAVPAGPGVPAPAPVPATAPAASAPEPEPPAGALKIVVSIPQQRAYVFKAGALVASAPVSTGRKGHPTPVGTFRILQKDVHHRSNIYSNAPMPYMQRLTSYGIALHAGPLPGYPASHGCIRLPWAFAKKLYAMTDMSTRVTVTREPVRAPDADASGDE